LSPRSEQRAVTATAIVLVAVGCLAWWLSLSPVLEVDSRELARFPSQVDSWSSIEIPLEAAVASMLQADLNLQRTYVHPLGDVIWLYVGYYGTSRGGRPEHLPQTCYRAHGWTIAAQRAVEIDPRLGLRANEYVVERDGRVHLVHFWYRSHRETGILSMLGLTVDHLFGRFLGRRADGALVRISTRLGSPEGLVAARGKLAGFGAALDALLADRWPTEAPVQTDG
jgi:EpsI family protein